MVEWMDKQTDGRNNGWMVGSVDRFMGDSGDKTPIPPFADMHDPRLTCAFGDAISETRSQYHACHSMGLGVMLR